MSREASGIRLFSVAVVRAREILSPSYPTCARALLNSALAAFKAITNFPVEGTAAFSRVPGVSWSDHLSFWRSGYPAL